MNPKYVIGAVAATMLVGAAVMAVEQQKIEYMDFRSAMESERTAQISGTWVKEGKSSYDPNANEFRFDMRDENGTVAPVILHGAKPNNFEIATSVVATGAFDGKTFHATNILTKCPSKYESTGDDLMEKYGK